ncbi:MAG: hypothetical protein V7637_6401 [Mycobacteriales bacterium]
MIVCRSCGHQNVDDAEFCASCRTYLAWDGDRVQAAAPAAPPTPPPPPPAPERRPGLVDQVLGAVRSPGGRGSRPAPEPAAPASGWPAGQTPGAGPAAGGPAPADQQGRHDFPPGPSAYPPGPSAFPPGPSAFPPGPTGPAAAQPGVATAAAGPQAVQPGPEQLLPPAEPTQPAVRRRPGARYCPSCGTENDPDRNLCRSCGAELAVVIARRPPWWRRLFGRSAPSAAAGDRPNRRRRRRSQTARRIFRGTVAGVLITAIVLLAGPFRSNVSRGYHKVKGLVSTQYQPVKAVSASASSAARGHPARNIIDGVKDTAWAEGVRGPGLQESVMINMGRRVDIARIGITPGASDNEKKFRATSRPRQIRVEFSNGRQQVVTLTDTPTFQQFDVSGSGVDHARLVIVATFPGQSAEDTSIAEIEFFSKS